MREIKFQAWNKKEKKMSKPFELVDMDEDYLIPEAWYLTDCIIRQFTGLCDKQGKEIYEGDIVTSHFIQRNVVVVFEGGKFLPQPVTASEKEFEVLGNIYENPELSQEKEKK